MLGFALVVGLTPAALTAQTTDSTPAPATDKQAEIQQITARLGQIQQQAMQDPEIKAANDQLTQLMESKMALDPASKQTLEQAKQYQADVAAAQAAGDNEKLTQLAEMGKLIQQGMQVAQTKVLSDPEVQKQMDAFKQQVYKKMVEIDPEAEKLVARLTELNG
jgi:hypothetical protein